MHARTPAAGEGTVSDEQIWSVAFDPAGNRIHATTSRGWLVSWDAETGNQLSQTSLGANVTAKAVSHSPTDPIIAVGGKT